MQPWAEKFYKSRAWQRTRYAYLIKRNYTCERCGRLAEMVHHRIYLTQDNISDPRYTLAAENLEALCDDCHAQEHSKGEAVEEGYYFDGDGQIHYRDIPPGLPK